MREQQDTGLCERLGQNDDEDAVRSQMMIHLGFHFSKAIIQPLQQIFLLNMGMHLMYSERAVAKGLGEGKANCPHVQCPQLAMNIPNSVRFPCLVSQTLLFT